MTILFSGTLKPLTGIAALCALSACSDLTGGNRQLVKLSFTTKMPASVVSGIRISPDLAVGATGDLVLTRVQLVIDKIELNENEETNCVDEIESSDDDDDDAEVGEECEDVERNPVLVDLPVDDALHAALTVPLTPGTYEELEAKLEPAGEEASAFNAANPNLIGKSVRVEGTYKGTPFVFTSSLRTSLEMEFNPPLVIDETTKNATVSIDVAKWFLDDSGAVIDPNSATEGSNALRKIEDNIRRSFHAFEDDDESGEDDHTEGHD